MKEQHPIPEAALNSASAIIGRTGAGKTYTAKSAVESLLEAGRRVCIVDPTGAWWGLRLRADGSEGFPVIIFGGDHGDVPISGDAECGSRLGEIVAAGDAQQCIIDVSDFSTGETTRFLTAFFEALYTKNRGAIHLVLDEADVMAPQNPMPEARRLQGVVNKIVRRGRIKGFRPMMITQRPQVLDKSVLSQVDTLVALRLTSPQDRKAILEWVRGHSSDSEAKSVIDKLAALRVGQGFVWSPSNDLLELVTFPQIRTFDSSRAPDADEETHAPSPIGGNKIADLRQSLMPKVDEPVTKDMKVAHRAPSAAEVEAIEERGEKRGYQAGFVAGWQQCLGQVRYAIGNLRSPKDAMIISDEPSPLEGLFSEIVKHDDGRLNGILRPKSAPKPAEVDSDLSAPQRRVIEAIAFWEIATSSPSRIQVACAAGYTPSSGGFNNLLGSLRSRGFIEYPAAGTVALTDQGADLRPAPDGRSVMERIHPILSAPQRKVLDAILSKAKPLHREDVAALTGYQPSSGGFNNLLGSLRSLGLIDYPKAGVVEAVSWLRRA